MSSKMWRVFSVVGIFTVFLYPLALSQLKVTGHVDQGKACEEYQRCMGIREKIKTTIKTADLGPDAPKFELDKSICAYQSNCRKAQRDICKTHMQANGSIEMKVVCHVTWEKGSDETDATDPVTAEKIESNQTIACSNYETCVASTDKVVGLIHKLPLIGDAVRSAKQILCAERTNCKKVQKELCDTLPPAESNHRLGQVGSILCAITWFVETDQNLSGSRSTFGLVSKSEQVLAQACPSAANGVCVIS